MKKNIFYLIFIVMCLGCEETDCPGFPTEYKSWLPFYKGKNVEYVAEDKTLQVLFDSISFSQAWSYKWNCKCECGDNYAISTALLDDETETKISISIQLSRRDTIFELIFDNYDYWISNGNGDNETYNDGFTFTKTDHYEVDKDYYDLFTYHNELIINNTTFNNVLEWQIDTVNHCSRIWKLYYAKGIGIVEFYERNPNKNWKMIDN